MSESVPAKTYHITDAKVPDLEKCWSACNGIDGFGHVEEDDELNKARRKHGECLESLPCAPRLILYRKTKASPLMVKLWTWRTIGADDDVMLLLGSLAKACHETAQDVRLLSDLNCVLIDWGGVAGKIGVAGTPGERYEIHIEVVDEYNELTSAMAMYRQFMKHFDHGTWK